MSRIGRFVRGIVLLRRHDRGVAYLKRLASDISIYSFYVSACSMQRIDLFHAGHRLGVIFPRVLVGILLDRLESYFVLDQWVSVSAS